MPPVKVVTSLTSMPLELATILPPVLLRMPPEKIEPLTTKMPSFGGASAEIVPLLPIPPRKVAALTKMPVPPAEILPLLVMPPLPVAPKIAI